MSTAETFLAWLSVREGRGIVRKGGNWLARDLKTGDTAGAQSADRLAQVLSADPELPKAVRPLPQG